MNPSAISPPNTNNLVPYINVHKCGEHNTNGYLTLGLCINSGYILNVAWKMYKIWVLYLLQI